MGGRPEGPAIGIAAISRRVVNVWRPMLDALEARGARLELIEFPRKDDADSRGLDDLPWPVRFSRRAPLDGFTPRSDLLEALNAELRQSLTRAPLDMILCCSANLAPENQLRSALSGLEDRPVIVGLQHGFVQWWPAYTEHFDFDFFGVFGVVFTDRFKPDQRNKVLALGMPELAGVTPPPEGGRNLLFLAQEEPPPEVMGPFLRELSSRLGLDPVVRPHPEHRHVFASLERDMAFGRDVPFDETLAAAAVVVSTGSTGVLRALAMGRKVVVLPRQGGEAFQALGVVAADIDTPSALAVLERQNAADFPAVRERFLETCCGSRSVEAVGDAADRLLALVEDARAWSGAEVKSSDHRDPIPLTRSSALAIDDPSDSAPTRAERKAAKGRAKDGKASFELEIARIRAEALQRELEALRTRLRADADKLIDARADAARAEARLEVMKETSDQRVASIADLERLKVLSTDLESRITVKDDYIRELEGARDVWRADESLREELNDARRDAAETAYQLRKLQQDRRRDEGAAAELDALTAGLEEVLAAHRDGPSNLPRLDQLRSLVDRLFTEGGENAAAARVRLAVLEDQIVAYQAAVETAQAALEESQASLRQSFDTIAAAETARGEIDLEVRGLRTQAKASAAEFEVLRARVAEMDRLPWRVIAIYRRVRRFIPTPLLVFIAKFLPRGGGRA